MEDPTRMRTATQCQVVGCPDQASHEFDADGSRARLCEAHASSAALAVREVREHLPATGLTYLPATGVTVLVQYEVEDSDTAEAAFRRGAANSIRQRRPDSSAKR